jgi:hypothetical protein
MKRAAKVAALVAVAALAWALTQWARRAKR